MGLKSIGEGKYKIYLEECPDCGRNRKVNSRMIEKIGLTGGVGAFIAVSGGFLASGVLAGTLPIIGAAYLLFGEHGPGVATRKYIEKQWESFVRLNDKGLFTCKHCGNKDIIPKAVLAESVDKKEENTSLCPNCKQAIDKGDVFCGNCGSKQEDVVSSDE